MSMTYWAGNICDPAKNDLSTWPVEPDGDFDFCKVKLDAIINT